jgi:hypothetical protein
MNKILKMILIGAEQVAIAAVPGASAVDVAARAIIKASSGDEKVESIFKTGVAVLQVIEAQGVDFAEEPAFQVGLYQAKAGFTLMAQAIQDHKRLSASVNG